MADREWEKKGTPAPWELRQPAPWKPKEQPITHGAMLKDRLLLGDDWVTGKPVTIQPSQLSTHLQVLGASGVGKSFFLEGMIKTLILQGQGICLIDPHGDLYHRVLDFCAWLHVKHPKARIAERVIPFDIAESKQVLGFNPIARNARVMTYQVVALMEAIRKAWGQSSFNETPRLARWLFNTAFALIEAGLTLIQSKYLLDPKPNPQREAIIGRLKHPDIRGEWEYIASIRDKERNEFTESSYNRMLPFLMHEVIRLILGRQGRIIDFPTVLGGRKILLVNLARQNTISEDYQRMLGTLLVNELLTAAFARPRAHRAPFYMFIDEFSRFVTKDVCEILDGGRKFGLHLILAHQHLNQLKQNDPEVYYSTLTNARLKSVFGGLSEEDLDIVGRELFTGEFNPELVKQEIWHTTFEPEEKTRLIESHATSESSGSGSGYLSNDSLGTSETMIPGSDLWAGPQTSFMHGAASGFSDSSFESIGRSQSRTAVPWYEYHRSSEMSSREFRSLEEQLYLKKAQLKGQPNQHHAFLLPGQSVQFLKTGTLIDHGERITDQDREAFKAEAFFRAGCFSPPEEIEREQQVLEQSLLTAPPIIIGAVPEPATKNEPGEALPKPKGRRTKSKPKPKPTIYDTIELDPDEP